MSLDPGELLRYKNNETRVYVLMADFRWHTADEIREVGGANGLGRLRALREVRYGCMEYHKEKIEGTNLYRYKLKVETVKQEYVQRIHNNTIGGRKKSGKTLTKTCPSCEGNGKVERSFKLPDPLPSQTVPTVTKPSSPFPTNSQTDATLKFLNRFDV